MIYLSLFLLLLGPNQDPAYLKSEVFLEGESSVCRITYSLPASASSYRLHYKKMSGSSWQTVNLTTATGHHQLSGLADGEVYTSKLSWMEGQNSFESEPHYFVTYQLLSSTIPDFENSKTIISNEKPSRYIHQLHHPKLSFGYHDKYQQGGGYLLGEVLDESNLVIARFYVPKESDGIYHVSLSDLPIHLDSPYEFRLSDNRNPDRSFQVAMTDVNNELSAIIDVSGLLIDCDFGGVSTVQFFSNITGGSAPFEVTWSITDQSTSTLVYGPQTQSLPTVEDVSVVTVDLPLPYVVTMSTFDSCGRFQEYTVVLSCGEENGENSILIEPQGSNSTNGSGSN